MEHVQKIRARDLFSERTTIDYLKIKFIFLKIPMFPHTVRTTVNKEVPGSNLFLNLVVYRANEISDKHVDASLRLI